MLDVVEPASRFYAIPEEKLQRGKSRENQAEKIRAGTGDQKVLGALLDIHNKRLRLLGLQERLDVFTVC